jgi:hypothetical protein
MKNIVKTVLAVIAGGILGFLMYKFIGCRSGACPLIGSPYISVAYGSILGFFVIGSLNKGNKNEGQPKR